MPFDPARFTPRRSPFSGPPVPFYVKVFSGLMFLVVPVLVIGIFALVIGALFAGCLGNTVFASRQREHAQVEAQQWLSEMYPEATSTHVVCQAQDTDQNGYVSCTARVSTAGQEDTHLNLECYAWVWNNFGDNTCREIVPLRGYGGGRSR